MKAQLGWKRLALRDPKPARRRGRESGYAYLMALFAIMLILISSQAVMQNLVTQGRRTREQETIWRGEQCVRAISLYYRKTGHYPRTMDDLKTGLPQLHFLRSEAYNDPMNPNGGSWRMIYVNGAGQLIGSTRYATLQQMALMDLYGGKLPHGATLSGAVSAFSLTEKSDQSSQKKGNGSKSKGAKEQSSSDSTIQPASPLANLKPTGPVEGPVVGGFLTGVAGVADKPSLIVYKGGKKYINWEFIWNPIEARARALRAGTAVQGAAGVQSGRSTGATGLAINPFANSSSPGSPASPGSSGTTQGP